MLKVNYFSDRQFILRIKENDRSVLGEIYVKYEKQVINYIKSHGGDNFDAEDMLQEAIIVLWQNVNNGKFDLSSKLNTYIVAVAKNKWRAELRKRNKTSNVDISDNTIDPDDNQLEILLSEEKENNVRDALNMIKPICKQLLMMFYFEEKNIEEITKILEFSNTNVTKSKKYQCKKSLESVMQKQQSQPERRI
ncbi:MAG: sigma-70 family RNA polymerase sigma factor [Calditrichia bacterium]|nr:sigma-70 family RNA polymerase sigma factor [Calditrichia bacterium]